jgi:hypothetical protein
MPKARGIFLDAAFTTRLPHPRPGLRYVQSGAGFLVTSVVADFAAVEQDLVGQVAAGIGLPRGCASGADGPVTWSLIVTAAITFIFVPLTLLVYSKQG